jgi:hypothetical protein
MYIPERFLRQLWKHQLFQSTRLQTTDGKPLEVISPGNMNRDGGPDFLDAQVRIGGTLYRGDIEIHRTARDWTAHLHDKDPKYNAVILHVVLSREADSPAPRVEEGRPVPVLALRPVLESSDTIPTNELMIAGPNERVQPIRCSAVNHSVDGATIREWIEKLSTERIELKIRRFEERLRELVEEQRLAVREHAVRYERIQFGLNPDELPSPFSPLARRDFTEKEPWAQLFYEGLMEALGYTKNAKPFARLAKNLTLAQFRRVLGEGQPDASACEALLFGAAGLIPKVGEMKDKAGRYYVRKLKSRWKVYRMKYHREVLHAAEWQFFRLRPENFPTIRLAGAAELIPRLLRKDFFSSLIGVVKDNGAGARERYAKLEEMLIVRTGEFWSNRYTFEEEPGTAFRALVGKQRADDMVVNVIIPIVLLYARIFKEKSVREEALSLLAASPAAGENTIVRQFEAELIRNKFPVTSAYLQQGLLRLHKGYCTQGRCRECAVGKIVFPGVRQI